MSRRRAAAWAGLAALAVIVAGSAPWPLPPGRVTDSFNAGGGPRRLVWERPQSVTFTALPRPRLAIAGARLDDLSGANVISAPAARIDLSLRALLSGRLQAEEAALSAAAVTVDLDRPPFALAGNARGADFLISALEPLARLSLSDGVVRVSSRKRGLDTTFANVQGGPGELVAGRPLDIRLSATWRGAPVSLSVALADPLLAAAGGASALRASLSSPVAELALEGDVNGGARFSVSGDFSASSPSVAALARLLGRGPPPFLAADDIKISGKVKATPTAIAFDEASATAAGQTVRGALDLVGLGARPRISATLDSDNILVAALFGRPAAFFRSDGGWSEKAFATAPLASFDLDLRLSARGLDLYGHQLSDVATSVILNDGVLTASLLDGAAYGGRLKSDIRLESVKDEWRLAAKGELTDADLSAASDDYGGRALTGKGSVSFAIRTAGASPAAAVSGLAGAAKLSIEQGSVIGVNLEQALRRSQRRHFDVARDLRVGETAFTRLLLELGLSDGVAHVTTGELVADGLDAELQGEIDLPAQMSKLRLNVTQTGESGDGRRLGFDIEGPWSKPDIRLIEATPDGPPAADPSPTDPQ
jgi:AsmA protein